MQISNDTGIEYEIRNYCERNIVTDGDSNFTQDRICVKFDSMTVGSSPSNRLALQLVYAVGTVTVLCQPPSHHFFILTLNH